MGNKAIVNLKMIIEYDGENYYGWQKQKNKNTVQGELEKAISILFPGEKINIHGAGRTDAGVSAYGQCANFKISKNSFRKFSCSTIIYKINSLLPYDIAVKKISVAPEGFHARYSAVSRTYKYFFTQCKKGIMGSKYYFIKNKFDYDKANQFLNMITGNHSFKSLCKNKSDRHNFLCNIYSAAVKKLQFGVIEFSITANRFLHSMVRAIAGVLIKVACSDVHPEDIYKKFINGEKIVIRYLPPGPLFLFKVNY